MTARLPDNRRHAEDRPRRRGRTMGRGIAGLCALAGFETAVFEARGAGAGEAARRDRSVLGEGRRAREGSPRKASKRRSGGSGSWKTWKTGKRRRSPSRRSPSSWSQERDVFRVLDRLRPRRGAGFEHLLALDRRARLGDGGARTASSASISSIRSPRCRWSRSSPARRPPPAPARPPREFAAAIGKQAIHVADSPGFATSRLGLALGLEAMRMVEEGVASAGRHRPGDGARLRPPDGSLEDDRPRRPGRAALDRRGPLVRFERGALPAAGDPRGWSPRDAPARNPAGLLPLGGGQAVEPK